VTLLRRLGNPLPAQPAVQGAARTGPRDQDDQAASFPVGPELRDQIAIVTNRTETFHNFSRFLMIGGRLIGHNDPDYQERLVKFNELVANAVIFPLPWTSPSPPMPWPGRGGRWIPTTWRPSPRTSPARSGASAAGRST
jgi:hypothetical protein